MLIVFPAIPLSLASGVFIPNTLVNFGAAVKYVDIPTELLSFVASDIVPTADG